MNLSDTMWTLHERTWLGDVFPVELLKQVQEMLWVNSALFDWDSDDEELMYVRMASIARGNASKKTPHVNTRNDAHMDPKTCQTICSISWIG